MRVKLFVIERKPKHPYTGREEWDEVCTEGGCPEFTRVPVQGEYIRLDKDKCPDGLGFHTVYRVDQVVHTPAADHAAELLVAKIGVPAGEWARLHRTPLNLREFIHELGKFLTWHDHMRD